MYSTIASCIIVGSSPSSISSFFFLSFSGLSCLSIVLVPNVSSILPSVASSGNAICFALPANSEAYALPNVG